MHKCYFVVFYNLFNTKIGGFIAAFIVNLRISQDSLDSNMIIKSLYCEDAIKCLSEGGTHTQMCDWFVCFPSDSQTILPGTRCKNAGCKTVSQL